MRAPLKLGLALFMPVMAIAAEQSLRVTATAYNSTHAQTDARPNKAAWGDRIEPGMKVLAVSPDLVRKGLKKGMKVRIDEIEGEWTVLDRTPSRLRNHIDIYMGVDVEKARKWGRRKVTIRWTPEPPAHTTE
jgi:3D (Asp-Asp-Asp) domain-containing protein